MLRSEETSGFSITAELRLLLTTSRSETLSCVADLYSTRCDANVETQSVTLPAAAAERSTRQESVQHLDFGRQRPFVFVTDADCSPPLPVTTTTCTPPSDCGFCTWTRRRPLPSWSARREVALPAVSRDAACALLRCAGGDLPTAAAATSGRPYRSVSRKQAVRRCPPSHQWSCSPTVSRGGGPLWSCAAWRRGEPVGCGKQYHTDEELIRTVNHLEGSPAGKNAAHPTYSVK